MARETLAGRSGSAGFGVGRLLWLAPEPNEAAGSLGQSTPNGRRDPALETARLREALASAADELSELASRTAARAGEEIGAIFEAQAMFAADPGIIDPAIAAIQGGASAAEAIERTATEQADLLAGVDDEYFRERAADLRDVGRRVADRLLGRSRPDLHHPDGTPAIVASDDLDPSTVAVLRPELIAGIALAGGAPTGHAAIVARAYGIPLVLGLGEGLGPRLDGRNAALDGTGGRLLLEPTRAELTALADGHATAPLGPADAGEIGTMPVVVAANVGSVREAEAAAAAGAQAIGLVRTELLFLGRSSLPSLEEQRSLYRRIGDAMAGYPVVFRTLDIGGDKPASYAAGEAEMNPALGVRGVRLSLARPELFETQVRALLEAQPDAPLHLLLPMVASIEELVAARSAIERAAAASRGAGAPISRDVRLGIMVEIPAAAMMADAFAPLVDFFSIGTNDLVQYALAADRTAGALAELATPLQPAILRLVRLVTDAARAHGRPVTVCGEAAADPAAAALFIGLGVGELSVAPGSIAALRAGLAGIDIDVCREAADRATAAHTVAAVRAIAAELIGPGLPTAAGSSLA